MGARLPNLFLEMVLHSVDSLAVRQNELLNFLITRSSDKFP
ncbi:hypothetical protein BTHERMOSOX_1537 [Bathymodiolus thermophilus thioautotrophic gill symbiont]|nr:hypothetical protein BTHERMOSOX_1537 [Bathymodiolus thermophilus thioautotrophic gill symbiont]